MSPVTFQFLHLFRMEPIFWKLLHMFKMEAFWKFLHVLGASFLKFFTWTKWRLFAESSSIRSKWRLWAEISSTWFKMAPVCWKFLYVLKNGACELKDLHVVKMAPVFWSSSRVQNGANELKVLPRVQNGACFLKFFTCFSEVLSVFKMAPVFWSFPRVQDGAHYGRAAAAVPGRHCQPLFNCGAFS